MSLMLDHHLHENASAFELPRGTSVCRARNVETDVLPMSSDTEDDGRSPPRPRSAPPSPSREPALDVSRTNPTKRVAGAIMRAATRLVLTAAVQDSIVGDECLDVVDGSHPGSGAKQIGSIADPNTSTAEATLTNALPLKKEPWWRAFEFDKTQEIEGESQFNEVLLAKHGSANALALAFLEMDDPSDYNKIDLAPAACRDDQNSPKDEYPTDTTTLAAALHLKLGALQRKGFGAGISGELKMDAPATKKAANAKLPSKAHKKKVTQVTQNAFGDTLNVLTETTLHKELASLRVTGDVAKHGARTARVNTQRALHDSACGFDFFSEQNRKSRRAELCLRDADAHRDGKETDDAAGRAILSLSSLGIDLGGVEKGFLSAIDLRLKLAQTKLDALCSSAATKTKESTMPVAATEKPESNKEKLNLETREDDSQMSYDSDDEFSSGEGTGKGLFKFNSQSAKTQPLRDFLVGHFDHPYPNDAQREEVRIGLSQIPPTVFPTRLTLSFIYLQLAAATDMTRAQVSNWFINARVRIWRPMILNLGVEIEREGGDGLVGGTENGKDCGGSKKGTGNGSCGGSKKGTGNGRAKKGVAAALQSAKPKPKPRRASAADARRDVTGAC
jgi:hypothetical protein